MPHPPALPGLRLTAGVIGGFGLLMLLGTLPPVDAAFGLLADVAHWPPDGVQAMTDPGARLLLAIGGGIALGWGALIWGLAGIGAEPAALRRLVIRSLWVWFLADSAFSVVVGAWVNVAGNLGFLALALAPLGRRGASG